MKLLPKRLRRFNPFERLSEGQRCPVTDEVHDYPMSTEGQPWHMVKLTCKYCGEKFYI